MNKFSILAILLSVSAVNTLHAQDDWHLIKSNDGTIEAMLPGPAKKKSVKRKTLAGTVTTNSLEFHTADVEFSVSSTKLSRFIRKHAKDERLYRNAREKVLSRFYGEQKSFEEIEIDGNPARELHYEVVDFHDESHTGYHGVAVFIILGDTIYAANAIMEKEAGNSDLEKFRKSIKIKKE